MVEVDPVLVGIMILMLVFVIFLYLMIRRAVLGFKEGMDRARDDRG